MNIDLGYFLSILGRRLPLFAIVVSLFASIGVSVALVLPPEYSSDATLLVEGEQIPESLAASTVQIAANEQLRIIEQRLLSRQTLLDVAQQLNLFTDPQTGQRTMDAGEIVSTMRDRTTFRVDDAVAGRGLRRGAGTVILDISYRGERPRETAAVVNELVTRVLDANVELRTAQASETLDFFEQEVERLNTALDAQSAQLLQFQSEAGVAVPENVEFLRGRLASLQDRKSVRTAEIERLKEQKLRLTELFERTGGVDLADGEITPLEGQLAEARRELLDAEVIFSPQNPKIRVLQARVEQLEQRVAQAADDTARQAEEMTGTEFSQARILFDAQMEEIDAQLAVLQETMEAIDSEMETVSQQITEATQNGFTIAKMQRDLAGIRSDFEQARDRLSAAETGERIELLAKGQRISVIEQALVPDSPISPNRPLIAAAGVGGGVFAALGLIVLLELLNKSIRRPIELSNRLGIMPIGVVPYLRTDREIAFKRTIIIGSVMLLVVGLPAMLLAFHTLVTPLDRLIEPVLNRIGLSIG